ncbi:phosphoglycerate mutase family protein [Roseobacter sp. YSTF-M11]|uniref:Phosphoglycerate mutase family protein n=1 Tax=Roseobacter insulae TaxID=2859783 RepID=A0A9X1FY16_9RHOB|nr:histidine phosphatase family protein [Roseobacter insulae]MBW4709013.1 phosphoglycerate mutase family protein [Roseobacter insulae]
MASLIFVSHPEVAVDAACPVTQWGLNETGHARARAFARSALLSDVTAIWSSEERKARDTAEHLAAYLDVPVQQDVCLGENDRTATGFLPPEVFERAADAFFANPETSFRGWERATDAQSRIVTAVRSIVAGHGRGDLAIVSHGAVGTLLYCALSRLPISRVHDQPGQGHYWSADLGNLVPRHPWRSIG